MFRKLLLACAVVVGGAIAMAPDDAQARRGWRSYGTYYRAPVRSYYYSPRPYSYYRSYTPYRSYYYGRPGISISVGGPRGYYGGYYAPGYYYGW